MRFEFPDGELGQWACLGHVSDQSVRVWLRDPSLQPHRATIEVNGLVVGESILQPSLEHDGIAVDDLKVGQPVANGTFLVKVAGFQRSGTLAPPPQAQVPFSFAFGSCHQPFGPPERGVITKSQNAGVYRLMQRHLAERDPRFLLLLGDQVYSDGIPGLSVMSAFN